MTTLLAAFITPGQSLAVAVERASLAEQLGYEAVFTTHIAQRDGLMSLAAYGAATERIALGTAVIPAFPRHPVALAYEAATLDEIIGGRLIVGIGTSHRIVMENWYGADMSRPLTQLKEYVTVLRSVLTTGRAEFSGDYYKVNFGFMGYAARAGLPIYLSGLSPKTLRFAGEAADGIILWACMPKYIREVVVKEVRAGELAVGRAPGSCKIVAAVPCAVSENIQGARDAFRKDFLTYMTLPFYRKVIAKAGFAHDIGDFDAALSTGDVAGACAAISDDLLEHFAGIGSPEVVRAKIAEYRAAGVDLPAVGAFAVPEGVTASFEETLEAAIAE
ncbi:MAG: LLM class flavin-dependent oxidoreductase [Actinomycetota bacterium]